MATSLRPPLPSADTKQLAAALVEVDERRIDRVGETGEQQP
jgi:hypothetical protein